MTKVTYNHLRDHGTIVQLFVKRDDDGWLFPINFDHRCFATWYEGWVAAGNPLSFDYDPDTKTVTLNEDRPDDLTVPEFLRR